METLVNCLFKIDANVKVLQLRNENKYKVKLCLRSPPSRIGQMWDNKRSVRAYCVCIVFSFKPLCRSMLTLFHWIGKIIKLSSHANQMEIWFALDNTHVGRRIDCHVFIKIMENDMNTLWHSHGLCVRCRTGIGSLLYFILWEYLWFAFGHSKVHYIQIYCQFISSIHTFYGITFVVWHMSLRRHYHHAVCVFSECERKFEWVGWINSNEIISLTKFSYEVDDEIAFGIS